MAHEGDQTHAEEAELERWITKLTRYGYPARSIGTGNGRGNQTATY